jgi:hypothetical protein
MYCPDNGRPSLPPSLLCGVLLLQFYEGVGDEEAVERVRFDLRWKVALGLPLDFAGFDPSSLVVFRKRLLAHGQERYAFDRFLGVAHHAGFLPAKLRQLIDSSPLHGAGALQDTYTLLRKGIRRLLKAMGFAVPAKRRGLATNLARYLEEDRKAPIDWADPQARREELGRLVVDADAALDLAAESGDDAEVRATGWLLTKILGDDLTVGEDGRPTIAQGVAEDRVISWTDPQMRHGRKTSTGRWDGAKLQVAEDRASELITGVAITAANAGDGASLLGVITEVEEHLPVAVVEAIGDTAYGETENQVACAARGIDLVAPVPASSTAIPKEAFTPVDDGESLTCPQGQTTTDWRWATDERGRKVRRFLFPRAVCAACPLFARCVTSKHGGRQVTLHYHEGVLRAARARQDTEEFRTTYRRRALIERKIAELIGHGLRRARYVGRAKHRLQALWTAAGVNLKRLVALSAGDADRLVVALAAHPPGRAAAFVG